MTVAVKAVPLGGVWVVPFAAVIALPWLLAFPSRQELRRGLLFALAGVSAAAIVILGLRIFHGPKLPAFIPPEESAAPGLALGVGAGILEEALFRFGALPALFFLLRLKWGKAGAASGAVLVTGLLFAISHEMGPGASPAFHAAYFVTRAVFPGVVMSAVFFAVDPAFIIAAHCAAHFGINLLFH